MSAILVTILFAVVPTAGAVLYTLNRPHLSGGEMVRTFMIWVMIALPVGFAVAAVSTIVYLARVSIQAATNEGILLAWVVPNAIILNIGLILLAGFRDERAAGRRDTLAR